MRRILCLLFCIYSLLSALFAACSEAVEEKTLTLMIYMCGTNLESQYGSASADIQEILSSGVDTRSVNILLMTGGAQIWQLGLDAEHTTISDVMRTQLRVAWQGEMMNMGESQTLTRLLRFGFDKYPAREYALILWDHGAGPLGGVCMDELNDMDRLTLPELSRALEEAKLPQRLSWLGFDACLMSSAEVAQAMAVYAQYMIASQATEPAGGWNYSFLRNIESDADGSATGKRIVDAYFEGENQNIPGLTLACLDLSAAAGISEAMSAFFAPIGRNMDEKTFALLSELRMASAGFGEGVRGISENGYDLVDLGDLIEHCSALGDVAPLEKALEAAVVYTRSGEEDFSGMSVYHPLHNKDSYLESWRDRYDAMGFSEGYNRYLNAFGALLTGKRLANWSRLALSDDGFGPELENLYSLLLEADQMENYASAQLIVLGAVESRIGGEFDVQLSTNGAPTMSEYNYYPVSVTEAATDKDGLITASYPGRALYIMDESGQALAGPIGYRLSEDGRYWYIRASYVDNSGREKPAPDIDVMFTCEVDEVTGILNIVSTEVYDEASETFTRRIAFSETEYTDMWVSRMGCRLPEVEGTLPGLEDWEEYGIVDIGLKLPLNWHLQRVDAQLSGTPLYATLEITDLQRNTYCTPLIPVKNPNLYDVDVLPRTFREENFELTLYAVLDNSALNAGLSLGAEIRNNSGRTLHFSFSEFVANGNRTIADKWDLYVNNVDPGAVGYSTCRIDAFRLAGLEEIRSLDFEVEVLPKDDLRDSRKVQMHCDLSGCDTSAFRAAEGLLASVETREAMWQLISLRKNARGGLTGLMYIENHSEEELIRYGNVMINGCIQTEDNLHVDVMPESNAYVSFEISNRAISAYSLSVYEGESTHFLAVYNLLERFGVEQIDTVTLCLSMGGDEDVIHFRMPDPIFFASAEEVARAQANASTTPAEQRLLLEAGIVVNVDRVLIAQNGAALRLNMRNDTDRMISLAIGHPTFDGMDIGDMLSDSFTLGAGATLIACVEAKIPEESMDCFEQVGDIGITFRYEDYTTNRAHILLNNPADLWAENGTYLSPEDFVTVPADRGRPDDAVFIGEIPEAAQCSVEASLNITNAEYFGEGAPEDYEQPRNSVRLCFRMENKSEDVVNYRFEDFVFNEKRYCDGMAFTMDLKPGEAGNCEKKLDLEALRGLEEITSLDCTMYLERNDDWNSLKGYSLHYDVSNCPLSGVIPAIGEDMAAEAVAEGVTWRLMSLKEENDGALTGLLYIQNSSSKDLTFGDSRILADRVFAQGGFNADLPAGLEKYIAFSYDNRSVPSTKKDSKGNLPGGYGSHMLQHLGLNQVCELTLLLGYNKKEAKIIATVPLHLETPVPLTPIGDDLQEDLRGGAVLLEGDISVRLVRAALEENGVTLTMIVSNTGNVVKRIEPFAPFVGGKKAAFLLNEGSRWLCLPADSIRVETVQVDTSEALQVGESMPEMVMSFILDEVLHEGASVEINGEALAGSGEQYTAGMLHVKPASKARTAPAVYETAALPRADVVKKLRLTAPVNREKVTAFDYGYVYVCMNDTGRARRDDGEYFDLPGIRELFRSELFVENGDICAYYSGLVLMGNDEITLNTVEASEPDSAVLGVQTLLYLNRGGEEGLQERRLVTWYWMLQQAGNDLKAVQALREVTDPATGEKQEDSLPDLTDIEMISVDRPLYFPEAPEYNNAGTYYFFDLVSPLRLSFKPVESIGAELKVFYDLHYSDGSSELIEAAYGA